MCTSGEMTPPHGRAPAWMLFFLAPATAELLSGASPPLKFFNPVLFVVLCVLYGCGAILVRELTYRWDKGWPTILALGAAYGLIEEGLMVKSLFDPAWPGLGNFGAVGRAGGVNWVWGVNLTLYHAVFSIAIPILLVELVFPQSRPWVGRRTLILAASLLAADVVFGFALMTPYRPPVLPYILTAVLVAGLIALARCLPRTVLSAAPGAPRPGRVRWVGLAAFLGTLAFFGVSWWLPSTGVPAWALICLTSLVVVGTFLGLAVLLRGGSWVNPAMRLSVAAGGLAFFILLTPLQEFGRGAAGMTLVGLAFLVGLIALALRLRRARAAPQPLVLDPPRG
jgi:hypothetical protein